MAGEGCMEDDIDVMWALLVLELDSYMPAPWMGTYVSVVGSDTPLKFNMVHLKMGPPFPKEMNRSWKPSFSGSMLNFGGVGCFLLQLTFVFWLAT